MKTKLLRKLREESERYIDLIKDRATSEYKIRRIYYIHGEEYYTPVLHKTHNKTEAEKLLKQARRQYILEQLGIKRLR